MILLMLINIVPINTLFIMAIASLILSIVIMEFGIKYGVVFYIGVVLLSFLLVVNRFHWIMYISTFGAYGIVKYLAEKNKSIVLEMILKLVFANVAVILLYLFFRSFIFIPINIILIIGFEVIFIVYDYMYSRFIREYNLKFRTILFKNKN
jgi:hypothetical protein